MRLTYERDKNHRNIYTLVIDDLDYTAAAIFPADLAFLKDCDAPDATIADRLLGLELLARRIQEARLAKGTPPQLGIDRLRPI